MNNERVLKKKLLSTLHHNKKINLERGFKNLPSFSARVLHEGKPTDKSHAVAHEIHENGINLLMRHGGKFSLLFTHEQ